MKQTNDLGTPSLKFVVFGIVLTGVFAVIVFLGAVIASVIYSDFTGNATFQSWSKLIYISSPIAFVFSYIYFSRRQIKHLILIYLALIVFVFSVTSLISFAQLKEQQHLLQRYQQFIGLVKRGKPTEAYSFTHPDFRSTHPNLQVTDNTWLMQAMNINDVSSPYVVHLRGRNQAIVVPDSRTNQWYHPSSGIFLEWEKLEGEWFYIGSGGLYLSD